MKIFISWSGEKSKKIANLIRNFLVGIFRDEIELFISTNSIGHGEQWFNRIVDELASANYGIFVITDENKAAPWILFEAGVLYKGVSRNRLSLFLVDVELNEISDPLRHFNMSRITKDQMFSLVKEIREINKGKMSDEQGQALRVSFDFAWACFEREYEHILIDFLGRTFNHQNMKMFIHQNNDAIENAKFSATKNTSKIVFENHGEVHAKNDEFVMQAYVYDEPQNWTPFIVGDYKLMFDVEMKNVSQLKFELKSYRYNINNTISRNIESDQQQCEILLNLGDNDSTKLKYVKELCFSVFNINMKDGECEFTISNLRIER